MLGYISQMFIPVSNERTKLLCCVLFVYDTREKKQSFPFSHFYLKVLNIMSHFIKVFEIKGVYSLLLWVDFL